MGIESECESTSIQQCLAIAKPINCSSSSSTSTIGTNDRTINGTINGSVSGCSTTNLNSISMTNANGSNFSTKNLFLDRVKSAFRSLKMGDYQSAIKFYSSALELDPDNHVLYGNRSAAFCRFGKYSKALQDAIKSRQLCPTWWKAYYRQGIALQVSSIVK